ncbi:hypothetical protein HYPSUDRAFT_203483 [Hypholoma sublateritium FD-334 SS-4]|uniref:Uncharacterized protein n=1 Tax=Hypholoma sublateritium (strain FD-334 SS-4) TaxID=945553 RepID=A0A0D2PLC2_HYPSF|nr:hypothetical protein HYPSUDRAFT_203483 [Hypholoma sublateritium FD-334 SS-4]
MSFPSAFSGSSQPPGPLPLNPTNNSLLGGDGNEDQGSVWKRRYHALQEEVNSEKTTKRKAGNTTSISQLGRGVRKVAFICDDADLNKEFEELNDDEVEELKREYVATIHAAVQVLKHLIPNFQKKIDDGSPEELHTFYVELQRGADSARSDDLNRIRTFVADWLNAAQRRPEILLDPSCRKNRGIQHDVTGRLLCPAEFDWTDLV